MPFSQPAPRGFRWADTPAIRAVLVVLIAISLGLSIYASSRYVGLVNCLQDRGAADARRTLALAEATDRERKAERELLALTDRDPAAVAALRQATIEAYTYTDDVRRRHPASGTVSRVCG